MHELFKCVRRIVVLTLPISATSLLNMISSFIAMQFVARLGKLELAAAALAIVTFITIMTVVATIFYAVSILISHSRAQQKAATEIGNLVKNGFWLAGLLAIPASILLWNIDKLLIVFGEDPQLTALTLGYFHFAAFAIFPILFITVISQFYTGIGKPKFMFWFAAMGFPLIIILSYGFILGKFHLPQLGLAGVTCASLCMQLIFLIGMMIYIYFKKEFKHYELFKGRILPQRQVCKNIFLLGLPIGIQFGGELAAMSVATYLMGYLGINALAAAQIVSQYSMMIVMIILALSQALSVLVSEAYGTFNINLIRHYNNAAILIFTMVSLVVFTVYIFIPESLIRFFIITNNKNLIHLTSQLFAIAAFLLFFDGIRNLFSGSLRGLQDSKAPMKIGIICLWFISLPLAYIIAFIYHGGPLGLRIGFMSGFLIAVLLLWYRIRYRLAVISAKNQPFLV